MSITTGKLTNCLQERGIPFQSFVCPEVTVTGVCAFNRPKQKSLTWLKRYDPNLLSGVDPALQLVIIVCQPEGETIPFSELNLIYTPNPKAAFFILARVFFSKCPLTGIAETAKVEGRIGQNVTVGHFTYVGSDVILGNRVCIGNHVSIHGPVVIGDDSFIGDGVLIGGEGASYYKTPNCEYYERGVQLGGVAIGNRVVIEAGCCIDRGSLGDTIIEDDVKVDAQCRIAHNAHVGKNVLIMAAAVICGSVVLEQDVYVSPSVVVLNQIHVGKCALIAASAMVNKNVPAGKMVAGVPAKVMCDRELVAHLFTV